MNYEIITEGMKPKKIRGILETEEDIRRVGESLEKATQEDFREYELARRSAREEALTSFLD